MQQGLTWALAVGWPHAVGVGEERGAELGLEGLNAAGVGSSGCWGVVTAGIGLCFCWGGTGVVGGSSGSGEGWCCVLLGEVSSDWVFV